MHSTEPTFESVLQRYAGAPVLVTGASGFVGRWVAHFLTRAGAELYLPARDPAGAKKIFIECGIEGKLFKLDLLDTRRVERSIAEIRPAVTFNLAGYGVNRSETSVRLSHEINTLLPERVAAAVAEAKPPDYWKGARLVHAGTAMEYGAVSGDLREDSNTEPTSVYGRSKLAGTEAVVSLCRQKCVPGLTARLFSVYGPGESARRLLPILIDAAANGTDRIELTAGLHKRDFTYVEDVAEALLRLGIAESAAGDVVNVATGTLTPVQSFARLASKILGMEKDRLSFGAISTRPDEMDHDPVSIDRLVQLTGWRPRTDLKEGLLRTLRNHRIRETVRLSAEAQEAACELF